MDLLESIGASSAGPAASGAQFGAQQLDKAASYYMQKNLNRQAQANTQKNMKLAAELNSQQAFRAIQQSTSALRAAGLSPALATSGNFTATGVSNPAGTASSAPTGTAPDFAASLLAGKQIALLDAEKRNLDAQTDANKASANKNNAEADSINLDVKHGKSFDSAVSPAFTSMLTEMKDSTENPFMKGILEEFIGNNSEIDLGTLKAFNSLWFDFSQKERDRELDFIAKEMDKKVISMQYSNGAAEALADLSKAQRMQIYRNMALQTAQISSLNAETSLTEDKRNAIKASVEKLGQETLSILHHDPAAMWNAGEISALGVMLGYEGIKSAMAAGGFAVGASTVGRAAPAVKGAAAVRSATLRAAPKPKGMSPENYSKVVLRARELAKGDKVKEAQLIDKAVRHWHSNYGD